MRVMCTCPSPLVVEMLGHLGFDWTLLDNEHGSIIGRLLQHGSDAYLKTKREAARVARLGP